MWTSRLVLNGLGFTDQGLYNVVGGFVGLASLLTASISNSISRFITYAIGQRDFDKVNMAVQNSITVQWILSCIVIILGMTVGLWFLNNKMVIPDNRIFAVNVVYVISIANMVVAILSSTLNAVIVAYEKMNVFACVSIINSIAALGVGFAVKYFGGDKLILYATLQLCIAIGVILSYTVYVRRTFKYIRLKAGFNKEIFGSLFAFAGWNTIGSTAVILRGSGTNVLLNIFGGPLANTINGIAYQVNHLVTMFVQNFTTAFTPQITKRYAAGEYESLIPFLHQCSRFSYSLLLIISVPIFLNVQPLLVFWLGKIPEGTLIFVRLIIIFSLIECVSQPLIYAKNATGDIRNFQIIVGGILLLTVPIAYLFLKIGFPIYYAYVAFIITSFCAFIARMVMLQDSIPLWSTRDFIYKSVSRCIAATIIGFSFPVLLHYNMPADIWYALLQCAIGFLWTAGCVYLISFNKNEQAAIIRMVKGGIIKLSLKKQ